MTTEIRAHVRRFPRVGGTPNGEHWCAVAYTITDVLRSMQPDTYEITWCGNVTEAITAALEMRAKLERQLMDEVHESRARRRAERCEECGKEVATLAPHISFVPGRCITPAPPIDIITTGEPA